MTVTAETQQGRRVHSGAGPVPFSRVVAVELRKMFDTRSGFWLIASIAITATLATGAVILFAPDQVHSYGTFVGAVGFPTAVILPIIAILAVTSEWTQRSGLTTFTLVPNRGKVIAAKAVAAMTIGAVSVPVAFAIGAGGNLVNSLASRATAVWDVSLADGLYVVLGNVLGLLIGFMLGVLIRNSAGAIVAYFVYSFVLPALFGLLATTQDWFRVLRPWVDFHEAQTGLFNGGPIGEQWAHLGTGAALWLVLPLAVGLLALRRSEVS